MGLKILTLWAVVFTWIYSTTPLAQPQEKTQEVIDYLQGLTQTRQALASTLDSQEGEVTREDFQRVCAPIGMSLRSWAKDKGYGAKQVSNKFRNPGNAPNRLEAKILGEFKKNRELRHKVVPSEDAQKPGSHVFVAIPVASSCLSCHGPKNSRPAFVTQGYPEDRAFDFKVGDLRGMFSVFIPKGESP